MSAEQLAQQLEDLIISTSDNFASEVERIQGFIYNRIIGSLKDLELDADGYIIQNASNRKILYSTQDLVDELLPGEEFINLVSTSLTAIPQIEELNSEYFYGISKAFNPNKNFLKTLQSQTIESLETTLLQDGITASIKLPLMDILNQNVNTGGSFSGMLEQVRNFIKGNDELDGRLLSYSRGILRDTLFNYSRSYQQAMTADLKLEYYMYAGGVMDKTRPFCLERSGNFYHEDEIKSWAAQEWQGKRAGTTESSIFIYAGGYNCSHALVPVHKSIVPNEQLKK